MRFYFLGQDVFKRPYLNGIPTSLKNKNSILKLDLGENIHVKTHKI